MARLKLVHWLCVATLLIRPKYALPSGWTSEVGDNQKPLGADGEPFDAVAIDDGANGFGTFPKSSIDPFIDVPFPSWLPQHVLTSRRDLITALSTAREFGTIVFTTAYPKILLAIKPTSVPLSLSAINSALATRHMDFLPDKFARAADLLLSGLAGPQGIKQIVSSYTCISVTDIAIRKPRSTVYPYALAQDAPYDIAEATLRSAIHIPEGFTYGKKMPLIMVPGIGVTGCETYSSNYAKLLRNSSTADPVFLDPPSRMLDDLQDNAEFIAYAINYISGISRRNVSVMAYAGGHMAVQWSLKYWPSARSSVSSYIAISPDLRSLASTAELCTVGEGCPPAILQQNPTSVFWQTLMQEDGYVAYVPTTMTWTIDNEDMMALPSAALYTDLRDSHGAGATLNPISAICGRHTPAGRRGQGQEAVLYNAHAVAVSMDALFHGGAADLERAEPSCYKQAARGLDVEDVMRTEALQLIAALNVNNFPNKIVVEPELKPYAREGTREQ